MTEADGMMTPERTGVESASICYVTTLPSTLEMFVIPTAEHLARQGGFRVVMVSNDSTSLHDTAGRFAEAVSVPMTRGISIDGIKAVWQLWRFFRREKFDIVQYSTPNAALYASIASTAARVPNRIYAQWGIRYVGFQGVRRGLFRALERFVCTLSTSVEPDSGGNLEFSIREGLYSATKGHVNWNGSAAGVDLSQFNVERARALRQPMREELGLGERSFVLGFVGRLCRDKGGNELLQAARELMTSDSDFHLLLVGSLELQDLDSVLLRWATHHPRVIQVGQTTQVSAYMSALDALTLPSYREGFGSVIIEAEAMGVPVIVTDIPGPLDAMLPNASGLVVPVGDHHALRDAIRRLVEDESLRAMMGGTGATFARENFDRVILNEHLLRRRRGQVASTRS